MSDNSTPRETTEPVAWALCDDEGVFDVEQDDAIAHEWVRGGADWGLVRWLRPLVFGDVAHPDDLRSALTAALAASTRTGGRMSKRKIVQISQAAAKNGYVLVVLCDDGSLWFRESLWTESAWMQVPSIPQGTRPTTPTRRDA